MAPPLITAPNTTAPPEARTSLRAELLVGLGLLAAAALVVAVASVVLFWGYIDSGLGALWMTLLVACDVVVFVALGAFQLKRAVVGPLALAVDATSAIAAGDLSRRVPDASTRELATLAASINRMTDHLLAEQVQRIRAEKLAGIGRLAAGVAHEIGNPLGAIIGYAHLLRTRSAGDPRAAEVLDGLERESARIDRIVRGLLDYARPRRSSSSRVDVNETICSIARLLTDQGVFRRIELSLTLDGDAPMVRGERHELEQMLVNLLLNAADAMDRAGKLAVVSYRVEPGELEESVIRREDDPPQAWTPRRLSPRVRHWLETTQPGAILKLVVADSGPGIADEDTERVFDPFFTTKEPGQGTGLGLAIVARVVEDLRGTIWVERAREGGAAFHVLLPMAAASLTPVGARGSAAAGIPAHGVATGAR
ncbi:MAG TPA: HAMP domain-containing sensor histidine kinase [Gemmatimonadaceae bacterium]|nr:HAMP domain-containing sensor histidine kinase [Gemmatimonadaceae bacterium]